MKAIVQRVLNARVEVNEKIIGKVDAGLLVYLGVARDDTEKDADWLSEKIPNLRIFDDNEGIMNLSLIDFPLRSLTSSALKNGLLVVSQFTLLADARKGRRPSWNGAAPVEKAKELYEYFINRIRKQNILCESGEFQARMKVTYTNDGPVTILLDSK